MTSTNPTQLLDVAIEAAWSAGRSTLNLFQTEFNARSKPDGTLVTDADRHAERLLMTTIRRYYPEHVILGEEFGEKGSDGEFRWIVDPIDGTFSFVHGVPLFGTLVGVQRRSDNEMVAGVAYFPGLDELVAAARGHGCRWNGRLVTVSDTDDIADATVSTTLPLLLSDRLGSEGMSRFEDSIGSLRGWTDCYGHILVATGRIDVMLDPVMNVWDSAALLPIVEEAGGTFTDWDGVAAVDTGSAVSSNGLVHSSMLELLDI